MARALYQSNKDIKDDMLLGFLFFYNLGDIKISENEMAIQFGKASLPSKYLKKISKVDAFRRATSKIKRKVEIKYQGEFRKAYIEADEVRCNEDEIVRIVGRKVVDSKNKGVDYNKIAEITYDRRKQIATSNILMPDTEFEYSTVVQVTMDRFIEWSKYHTRDTVRNIAISILKDMHPVNLLDSGLCKFIPKKTKNDLYKLQDLIRLLNSYCTDGSNVFEVIPVIDTIEQRNLISNSAQREVIEELHNLQTELKLTLETKATLPSRTVASYLAHYKELRAKVGDYEELLGTYMGTIQEQIKEAINYVEQNREIAN